MDVFHAVAEPNRRAMLEMLALREHTAGEIGAAFRNLSQPAASRHLKVLRQAGLVRVRGDAQKRIYSLEPARLAEIDQWLERYRAFWSVGLDALERHLKQAENPAAEKDKKRCET